MTDHTNATFPGAMQIYLYRNDQQEGPFTEEQLRDMVKAGAVNRNEYAWHDGLTERKPLYNIIFHTSATLNQDKSKSITVAAAVAGTNATGDARSASLPVMGHSKYFLKVNGVRVPPVTKDELFIKYGDSLTADTLCAEVGETKFCKLIDYFPDWQALSTQYAIAFPKGIDGWLMVPATGLIIYSIFFLYAFFKALFLGLPLLSDVTTLTGGLFMIATLVLQGAIAALFIYSAVCFFRRRRNAPGIMIFQMLIVMAMSLLTLIGLSTHSELSSEDGGILLLACIEIVGALIWIPYFLISKRVKRTFVRP